MKSYIARTGWVPYVAVAALGCTQPGAAPMKSSASEALILESASSVETEDAEAGESHPRRIARCCNCRLARANQ